MSGYGAALHSPVLFLAIHSVMYYMVCATSTAHGGSIMKLQSGENPDCKCSVDCHHRRTVFHTLGP